MPSAQNKGSTLKLSGKELDKVKNSDWIEIEQQLDTFSAKIKSEITTKIQSEQKNKWAGVDRSKSGITEQRIEEIKHKYKELIAGANRKGYLFAARALQRYLDNTGSIMIEDAKTLEKFGIIRFGAEKNRIRFESDGPPEKGHHLLKYTANELGEEDSKIVTDHWYFRVESGSYKDCKDLFYASNYSTICSMGAFKVITDDGFLTIKGMVEHYWYDYYDFEKNMGFDIEVPFIGRLSDDDGWVLEKVQEAKSYRMESSWRQDAEGTFEVESIYDTNRFILNWT
jgi:hypothetical protein